MRPGLCGTTAACTPAAGRTPGFAWPLWRAAVAVFALALPAGRPSAAHAALPDAAGGPWVEVRSAHFTACSNTGELTATRVARHLERPAETIERTTTCSRVDGGRDIRVFVFRDRGASVPYSPFREPEGSQTGGSHVSGDDAEHIEFGIAAARSTQGLPEYARRAAATADDLRFSSHEYLHAVISRSFGYLPVWANEGLGALIQARENHPLVPEVEGATALLQMRAGNRGAAIHYYRRIPRGEHRDYWRASAGYLIGDATIAEATAEAGAQHVDEAESLATDLQRTVVEAGAPARGARRGRPASAPRRHRTRAASTARTSSRPAPTERSATSA